MINLRSKELVKSGFVHTRTWQILCNFNILTFTKS